MAVEGNVEGRRGLIGFCKGLFCNPFKKATQTPLHEPKQLSLMQRHSTETHPPIARWWLSYFWVHGSSCI